MTTDDLACLRDTLKEMRVSLAARLARKIDGGDLALLGSVAAALAAVRR